jgi:hypothetical protein
MGDALVGVGIRWRPSCSCSCCVSLYVARDTIGGEKHFGGLHLGGSPGAISCLSYNCHGEVATRSLREAFWDGFVGLYCEAAASQRRTFLAGGVLRDGGGTKRVTLLTWDLLRTGGRRAVEGMRGLFAMTIQRLILSIYHPTAADPGDPGFDPPGTLSTTLPLFRKKYSYCSPTELHEAKSRMFGNVLKRGLAQYRPFTFIPISTWWDHRTMPRYDPATAELCHLLLFKFISPSSQQWFYYSVYLTCTLEVVIFYLHFKKSTKQLVSLHVTTTY